MVLLSIGSLVVVLALVQSFACMQYVRGLSILPPPGTAL